MDNRNNRLIAIKKNIKMRKKAFQKKLKRDGDKKRTKIRKRQQLDKMIRNIMYLDIPKNTTKIIHRMNECFGIKGIYLNIMSFLGSITNNYKIKKRRYDERKRRYDEYKKDRDKYIYHLSIYHASPRIGIGCPIINFYIQNQNESMLPYIRKISILNKDYRDISSEILKLECFSNLSVINNILYKQTALKFYNKYPKFFNWKHKCEKYSISEIPWYLIERCDHEEHTDNCNYCNAMYETPYTCDCNGFQKRNYEPQYTHISCDQCATLDVNNVPKNVTRHRDYCIDCRGGLSDMYQDMADDARDDY